MKELRRNMRLVGALVVAAFLTLSGWFALTVFEQGSIWASNSYNTRLAATGAQRGDITDRDGATLATTVDGERVYLSDASARRALAATVGDTAGMSGTGVEGYYSSQLLDLSGSLAERLGALFSGSARKGNSVKLTVDAQLTAYIASIFPEGYRGAACVINYKTGEVLAMVSKPDYDPYEAGGEGVEDTAYLNRCLQGLYTPGSVFKIVTLAAALEHDPNVLGQTFVCSGEWEYDWRQHRLRRPDGARHGRSQNGVRAQLQRHLRQAGLPARARRLRKRPRRWASTKTSSSAISRSTIRSSPRRSPTRRSWSGRASARAPCW